MMIRATPTKRVKIVQGVRPLALIVLTPGAQVLEQEAGDANVKWKAFADKSGLTQWLECGANGITGSTRRKVRKKQV